RGHVLLLVLCIFTTVAALGLVLSHRLGEERDSRKAELRRAQALWLARGAAAAGKPGTQRVPIERGSEPVNVNTRVYPVSGGTRVVTDVALHGWGSAEVEATLDHTGKPTDWHER